MDRFGIFVDAGYLYAASGKLCFGVRDRNRLVLNAETLSASLVELAKSDCGLEHLRTYWYDGARSAQATPEQRDIASLPGLKLRLGQLTTYGQKGVDSRIVRDLIILSVERGIATAYLLGGDEDLREGVAEAQERGVRVVLVAIEPLDEQNLAQTLVREVDAIVTLDRAFIEPHIGLRKTQEPYEAVKTGDPTAIGREVGARWWEQTAPELRDEVLRDRPRIAREIDRDLLRAAADALSGGDISEEWRHALRGGFWEACDEKTGETPQDSKA